MAKAIKIDKNDLPFVIDTTGMTYEVTKNVKVNLDSYILFVVEFQHDQHLWEAGCEKPGYRTVCGRRLDGDHDW